MIEIEDVVNAANELLVSSGVAQAYFPFDELKAVINRGSSSMFVALFEAILKVRLEGIIRQPTMESHYVRNAELVIDAVKNYCLQLEIGHLSPIGIARSDLDSVYHLLEIFKELQVLMRQRDSSIERKEDGSDLVFSADLSSIEGEESEVDTRGNSHSRGGKHDAEALNQHLKLKLPSTIRVNNQGLSESAAKELLDLKQLRNEATEAKRVMSLSTEQESKIAFQRMLQRNVEKFQQKRNMMESLSPKKTDKIKTTPPVIAPSRTPTKNRIIYTATRAQTAPPLKRTKAKTRPDKYNESYIGEVDSNEVGLSKKEEEVLSLYRKLVYVERSNLHDERERFNLDCLKDQQNRNNFQHIISKHYLQERENLVHKHVQIENELTHQNKNHVRLAINTICGEYSRDLYQSAVNREQEIINGSRTIINPVKTRRILHNLDVERSNMRIEETSPSYIKFKPLASDSKATNKEKKILSAYRKAF